MSTLGDNPYSPSTAVAVPQPEEALRAGPKPKAPGDSLMLLIVGTVSGGYAGNLFGTFVGRLIGLTPGPLLQVRDFSEITHPLGVGLLVVGGISCAWIGQYIGGSIRASRTKAADCGHNHCT